MDVSIAAWFLRICFFLSCLPVRPVHAWQANPRRLQQRR